MLIVEFIDGSEPQTHQRIKHAEQALEKHHGIRVLSRRKIEANEQSLR